MISTIVWHKFPSATGLPQPLTLHIPAYTKTETLAILQHQSPPGAPLAHFRQFVELLWGVFHGPCRDLSELRHLTCLLFDKYYAPVREGTISPKNTAALYKNIAPVLKSHLSNLYLRETSTSEWLQNDGKAAQQLDSSVWSLFLPSQFSPLNCSHVLFLLPSVLQALVWTRIHSNLPDWDRFHFLIFFIDACIEDWITVLCKSYRDCCFSCFSQSTTLRLYHIFQSMFRSFTRLLGTVTNYSFYFTLWMMLLFLL